MEEVERTNTVVVRGQRQGQRMRPPRRDPYTIEVDRRRKYYACGEFRHMAQHCRNKGQRDKMAEGRRLEYRQ